MKFILSLVTFLSFSLLASARFTIGGTGGIYKESHNNVDIYCLNNLSGAYAEYTTGDPSVRFFKYSASGKIEIPLSEISYNGNTYTINNLEDGYGYEAQESGGSSHAIFIIDYRNHLPVINSVTVLENKDNENNCQSRQETLSIDEAENNRISYLLPNLEERYFYRSYKVRYEDYKWDTAKEEFATEIKEEYYKAEGNDVKVPSPLKDTQFVISGDKIADELGLKTDERTTEMFSAVRVEPHMIFSIEGEENENDNENETASDYSAPLTVNFEGISNEPATIYYTWYIYKGNPEDDDVKATFFNERAITYTFNDAGNYSVVLEAASTGSTCVAESEPETFEIAESSLKIPNFFSPGNSAENHKEFKVKHRSLVKFKCYIFNRWGNKVYEFDDPDQGWDGRYKGKLVNPGVYFYVIEATGSEGKKYLEKGDINILRSE